MATLLFKDILYPSLDEMLSVPFSFQMSPPNCVQQIRILAVVFYALSD